MNESSRPKARVLFVVTEDWYFLSHRLPMALAAQRAGYEVHVATQVGRGGADIERHGFVLHHQGWHRGSTNPLKMFRVFRALRRRYREIAPDLVHHVGVQPSVIGSLAARGLPMRRLNALTGLGFGFVSKSAKARLMRPLLRMLLGRLLRHARAAALVQNPDDRAAVLALGVSADKVFVIPGSGVDTDRLTPLPEPEAPFTLAFVGRMLDDKGVRTIVAAHDILTARGEAVRLLLAGERDPANPASVGEREIAAWSSRPGVEMLGHVADIGSVWSRAHVAVLASRREGLPKSLLEAAAFGRAIVATDVPGCREIARHEVNALLVPPDDPRALADAVQVLLRDPDLRRRLADAGRRLAEAEFSADRIGRATVELYERLLSG